MPNFGLIESKPDERDYRLGGETKLPKTIVRADRDWTPFLPSVELQKDYVTGFDNFACVTYSGLNCLEVLAKSMGLQWNRSDRFTAKKSGTVPGVGNYLNVVAESVRTDGTVDEKQYPMVGTVEEYYADLPHDIVLEAKNWLLSNKTGYEWVDWGGINPEKLWEALQYAPIQVTVDYSAQINNEIYKTVNHAVMVFAGEYGKSWKIFDHYSKSIHVVRWDFYFGSAMRYYIFPSMLELVKGTESPDVFVMGKDGKKYRIEDSMEALKKGVEAGLWSETIQTKPQVEVDAMPLGATVLLYSSFRDV